MTVTPSRPLRLIVKPTQKPITSFIKLLHKAVHFEYENSDDTQAWKDDWDKWIDKGLLRVTNKAMLTSVIDLLPDDGTKTIARPLNELIDTIRSRIHRPMLNLLKSCFFQIIYADR